MLKYRSIYEEITAMMFKTLLTLAVIIVVYAWIRAKKAKQTDHQDVIK